MSQIWLIIWRFQPFHKWHELLIDRSLQDNPITQVLIWSSNIRDLQNPYSYEMRKQIIYANYPDKCISISALPDFPTDEQWSDNIVKSIPKNTTNLNIYCWDTDNDSAVQSLLQLETSLPFEISIIEIPRSIIPISATQIRNWIQKWERDKLEKYLSEKTMSMLEL